MARVVVTEAALGDEAAILADLGVKGGDLAYGAVGAYSLLIMMMLFSGLPTSSARRETRGSLSSSNAIVRG